MNDKTPTEVVESHPVFAALSPEARKTIARTETIRRDIENDAETHQNT